MGTNTIELRLGSVAQLFHTLDPSPFRRADLAAEADAYITDCARELPHSGSLRIALYLPPDDPSHLPPAELEGAIHAFFARRVAAESRALRELFRFGRRALAIGVAILSLALLLAWWLSVATDGRGLAQVAQESLVIVGWVAIWRPAEVFLYDWLPIVRARDLARRLSVAEIEIRAATV